MTLRVLVAGASGHLGREVVGRLQEDGHFVRALTRGHLQDAPGRLEVTRGDLLDPASLAGTCVGVDAVISCAGASLDPRRTRERAPYEVVDLGGNRNLLSVAEREGVRRFVYVSVFSTPELSRTPYVAAHERFAELVHRSPVQGVVIRPTGFHWVFAELLDMARRGLGVVLGSGEARTNPIHEADVAALCVDALGGGEAEVAAGGPDVLTRREVLELAFEVIGSTPRVRRLPPWVILGVAAAARPVNPRISELLRFGTLASTVDVVAPRRGRRQLRAYFEALAGVGTPA